MKLLKVSEVARMLNVSRQTIYDLIHKNKIKYYRLSERGIRIPEAELFSWLDGKCIQHRKSRVIKLWEEEQCRN